MLARVHPLCYMKLYKIVKVLDDAYMRVWNAKGATFDVASRLEESAKRLASEAAGYIEDFARSGCLTKKEAKKLLEEARKSASDASALPSSSLRDLEYKLLSAMLYVRQALEKEAGVVREELWES